MSKFNEFEPRLESAKNRFQLRTGLDLETLNTILTLTPLGSLKTRICWGGGQFDPPPSKYHVLCPNMTNDTSLESSCALLLESAKKLANLQKLNFLSQNPVI